VFRYHLNRPSSARIRSFREHGLGAHFSRPPRTPTLRPTVYATRRTSTLI
jgi:hypothetical protein